MKCPLCQVQLTMSDRYGVEVDYCSNCRGVWLDRGELDKILERSRDQREEDERRFPSPAYAQRRKPFWEQLFD